MKRRHSNLSGLAVIFLLVRLTPGLPHLEFEVEDDDSSSSDSDSQVFELTPDSDVLDYFRDCPMHRNRLNTTCDSPVASCADRCGEFLNGKNINSTLCSCDVFCGLHGDCCWDFETHCSDLMKHYRKHYSHIQITNITCEEDRAIIEDCGNYSSESIQTGYSTIQPVVTYKNLGINFRNIEIYKKCLRGLSPENDILVSKNNFGNGSSDDFGDNVFLWGKMFATREYFTIEDVLKLLNFSAGDILEGFYNTPPKSIETRACRRPLRVRCSKETDTNLCGDTEQIYIESMTNVCGVYSGYRSEWWKDRRSSTPLETTEEFSTYINSLLNGKNICYTDRQRLKSDFVKGFGFSFLANFNRIEQEWSQLTDFEHMEWKSIQCIRQSPKDNCKLVVICKTGFIFSGFECVQPDSVTIQVIGNDMNYIYNLVSSIFIQLSDRFVNDMEFGDDRRLYVDRVEFGKHDDAIKIKWSVPLLHYGIYHEGLDLPFTWFLSDIIRKADVDHSKVFQITICTRLLKEEWDADEREQIFMSCDRILSFPKNFTPYHFNVVGADIPIEQMNSFNRKEKTKSSSSENNMFKTIYYVFSCIIVIFFILP